MANASIAVYAASGEIGSSLIESFAESGDSKFTVQLRVSALTKDIFAAMQAGTRFQSVTITEGTTSHVFDSVLVVSFDISASGDTPVATITFGYATG